VAYICNPSYSRGRDKESRFKASLGKKLMRLHLEKPFTKIGLVEWLQGEGPEFKPQYWRKKKQKKKPLQYHQNETTKMTFNLKCVQELIIKPNIINLLGEKEKAS
jgi:hypothetical protein